MSKVELTIDELMAYLKHSNVPNLVAEGKDDIIALRRLEDKFSAFGLSVLPAHGRKAVLSLFEKRHELPETANVLFMADKDVWLYTGLPEAYQNHRLRFTNGYSIENDLFEDGQWERLLSSHEVSIFHAELDLFVRWYAAALNKHLIDPSTPISLSPTFLLNQENLVEMIEVMHDGPYPESDFDNIRSQYISHVRGKSLVAILMRQLCKADRVPKHNTKALFEVNASQEGTRFTEISDWLALQLENVGT